MAKDIAQHVNDILVAIRAWKLENSKVHLAFEYSCAGLQPILNRELFDFKSVILDHRVTQYLVAGIIDLFAGAFFVRAVQFDFEILSDVHRPHAVVAHMRQGTLHRLPLWVQHRFFWCNDDLRFHFKALLSTAACWVMCGK